MGDGRNAVPGLCSSRINDGSMNSRKPEGAETETGTRFVLYCQYILAPAD